MTSSALLWTASPALPQSSASFQYDAAGRLTCVLYPNGSATSYQYDPASNRTRVVHSASGCQVGSGGGGGGGGDPGDPQAPPGTVAITADQSGVTELDGAAVTATFTITRSVSTTGAGSVSWSVGPQGSPPYTASVPQDFVGALSGTVSFAANETFKQISVQIAGDNDPEPVEYYTVNLSAPVNVSIALNQGTAQGAISDDDSTIENNNTAPLVNADSVDTPYETPITFNPLYNDLDEDTDPITIVNVTQPAGGAGTVTFTANSVTFTPASGYSGLATFNYYVSDGQPESPPVEGQISVTVDPPAPTIIAVDDQLQAMSYYDPEANYYWTMGCTEVLANDVIPPQGATIIAVGSPGTGGGSSSEVCINVPGYGAGGTFTYTIQVNGSTATSVGTVTIQWSPW